MADTTAPDFKVRALYTFDMYPVPILGATFSNVTVLVAAMDEETARQYIGTAELHAQVYPFLPAGTPDDPTAYDYVRIRTLTGDTTVLGIPWIKPESIVLVDSNTLDITVGQVTAADVPKIRNALLQLGYPNLAMNLRR